jgi:hypothetical protein
MVCVDENGFPDGASHTLAHNYRIIKSMPLTPIDSAANRLTLEKDEVLYLRSRPQILKREREFRRPRTIGLGTAFLTDRRFVLQNSERTILEIPLERMLALSTDPGDRFHFVFEKKVFHITFRDESILKWFDTINRMKNNLPHALAASE